MSDEGRRQITLDYTPDDGGWWSATENSHYGGGPTIEQAVGELEVTAETATDDARCPHGVDRSRVYCPPCGPDPSDDASGTSP